MDIDEFTALETAQASFTQMKDGTPREWLIVGANAMRHSRGKVDRLLDHLMLLEGDSGGFAVDRLEHSLQTATRARLDGRDEEYVVCALLHDIGDTLGCHNHADIAAAILKPFVSPKNHWMVENHGIFQGYYYFHHLGFDRNVRDRFKDDPNYARTAAFCEDWDQVSFDPNYKTLPIEHFEPMVKRVLATPKSPYP